MSDTQERLLKRIMVLNSRVWEGRMPQARVESWLANFTGLVADPEVERLHALFWLSQFMYYGSNEIRVLLRSLFRDLYFCPMVQDVRARLGNVSTSTLTEAVKHELAATLFFGVGNPSESGIHLLYYFRQENDLARKQFLDVGQIFNRDEDARLILNKPETKRYVFLDDVCGSGDTAVHYSLNTVSQIAKFDSTAQCFYFTLFASSTGLHRVRTDTKFGNCSGAVHEFDSSYRALENNARYFTSEYNDIDPALAQQIARVYGMELDPEYASGFKNAQLMLGFHHNTPDNTLGIFWQDHLRHASGAPWTPAFKRYPKAFGDES